MSDQRELTAEAVGDWILDARNWPGAAHLARLNGDDLADLHAMAADLMNAGLDAQQRLAAVTKERDELRERLRVPCEGCPGCSSDDCPDVRDRHDALSAILKESREAAGCAPGERLQHRCATLAKAAAAGEREATLDGSKALDCERCGARTDGRSRLGSGPWLCNACQTKAIGGAAGEARAVLTSVVEELDGLMRDVWAVNGPSVAIWVELARDKVKEKLAALAAPQGGGGERG